MPIYVACIILPPCWCAGHPYVNKRLCVCTEPTLAGRRRSAELMSVGFQILNNIIPVQWLRVTKERRWRSRERPRAPFVRVPPTRGHEAVAPKYPRSFSHSARHRPRLRPPTKLMCAQCTVQSYHYYRRNRSHCSFARITPLHHQPSFFALLPDMIAEEFNNTFALSQRLHTFRNLWTLLELEKRHHHGYISEILHGCFLYLLYISQKD